MANKLTANKLNKFYKLNLQHCLLHMEGNWYHNLTRFPGGYFDANGLIVFETEEEYRHCPDLAFGEDVHVVPNGHTIASIKGYKVLSPAPSQVTL